MSQQEGSNAPADTGAAVSPNGRRTRLPLVLGITADPSPALEPDDRSRVEAQLRQFFTWLPEGSTREDVEKDALLGQIPAVKTGGLAATNDQMLTLAVSASSPLSLPWALTELTPLVAEAAQKAQDAK